MSQTAALFPEAFGSQWVEVVPAWRPILRRDRDDPELWSCEYVRLSPSASPRVTLALNAAKAIENELARHRNPPKVIWLCREADAFPPSSIVQQETLRVIETLVSRGIRVVAMTRGYIKPRIRNQLSRFGKNLRLAVSITTLDRGLCRWLEPGTAAPSLRLRLVEHLKQIGVPVHVCIDPLVPGVTDPPDNLRSVLAAVRRIGVGVVTAGYLRLTRQVEERLRESVAASAIGGEILEAYGRASGADAGPRSPLASARYRQNHYAMLKSLAAESDITVRISSVSNPDLVRRGTGRWNAATD